MRRTLPRGFPTLPRTRTIPVMVDAIKHELALTRCTYFSIEQHSPGLPAALTFAEDNRIPFLMLGLSGVIAAPLGGKTRQFTQPGDFEQLFALMDVQTDFYIDTNELWLPTELLERGSNPVARGGIYRIGAALFLAAYALQDEARSGAQVLEQLKRQNVGLAADYSKEETHALNRWQTTVIEAIRKAYHARPQQKLRKKAEPRPDPEPDSDSGPGPGRGPK